MRVACAREIHKPAQAHLQCTKAAGSIAACTRLHHDDNNSTAASEGICSDSTNSQGAELLTTNSKAAPKQASMTFT